MTLTNYRVVDVVLVSNGDHGYLEADLLSCKVVLHENGDYSEYVGDDYLEEGDEVVLAQVVY